MPFPIRNVLFLSGWEINRWKNALFKCPSQGNGNWKGEDEKVETDRNGAKRNLFLQIHMG